MRGRQMYSSASKEASPSGSKPEACRLALLLIAGGFLLYGIFTGQAAAVFQKARMICLECIGIG